MVCLKIRFRDTSREGAWIDLLLEAQRLLSFREDSAVWNAPPLRLPEAKTRGWNDWHFDPIQFLGCHPISGTSISWQT